MKAFAKKGTNIDKIGCLSLKTKYLDDARDNLQSDKKTWKTWLHIFIFIHFNMNISKTNMIYILSAGTKDSPKKIWGFQVNKNTLKNRC